MNIVLLLLAFTMNSFLLFDFTSKSNLNQWSVVDDVVMGGRSSGNFYINEEGNGVFSGNVSLENNGGFSSVRYGMEEIKASEYSKVVLRIKGDGKPYQFRIKSSMGQQYSYIQSFETNGEWQTVEIQFEDFYPSFRGRKLDQPNYSGKQMEEVRFLIANKKAQDFKLEIDKIELK